MKFLARESHAQASIFAWPAEEPQASLRTIYVWQAYRQPPVFEEARLNIQCSDGLIKVLLLFNTEKGLATFIETYESPFHAAKLKLTPTDTVPQAHLDTLIFALHKHVMLKTAEFLSSTLHTLYYQDLAARDDRVGLNYCISAN